VGFFQRLFSRKAATSEDIWRELYGAPEAKSGARVNYRTALEASTAMGCARVIAEGLAQVPLKPFQQIDDERSPATTHPLYDLLNVQPNPWQTAFEFREQLGLHLVFCGNAYSYKVRAPGTGRLIELLPFEPQTITVKRDGYALSYKVQLEEGREPFMVPAADMWHIRGPSWNGWMGLEGVKLAREAIGLALATEEHGARLFSNGATVGGVLSTDQILNQEQREELRKSWERTQGGAANAFKTAVLWGGMKWEQRGLQSDHAQFLETRRFQVEEVCRAMRVMPIMVGYSDKASTYASAEQMFLAHLVHTMGPWYTRVEQSADANLLSAEERAAGYYCKHVVQALMRGTAVDRSNYYTKLYAVGALNPNEIRALEEMNPYEGGETYRVPANMVDPTAPPPEPAAADTAEEEEADA
jgi:HK97 family phage portal protein